MTEHPTHDASLDSHQKSSAAEEGSESTIDPADRTEDEFLDAIVQHLHSGQRMPSVCLSEADLETIEAEPIGEHFSRFPFLY